MPSNAPINTILVANLEKSRAKLAFASLKANVLQAWAFSNKRIEYEDGGHTITNPLITGRNPNVTSYSYYGTLPTAQTDEFSKVSYNWSRVAGTVIISEQEEDENKGRSAVIKLMKSKTEVLEESFKEKNAEYLHGAGAGDDPYGLPAVIPADPTTGSLGGLSRSTGTQWRTSAYNFAGALDNTNIEEALDDILLDLTNRGDRPDIIVLGRNLYRFLRAAVRDKTTIPLTDLKNGKRMVDLGFIGMTHEGIPVIRDEDCPNNTGYVINSKHLRTHILKDVNMRVKELTSPWNTDARGARITQQYQLCLWNANRKHAIITN